MNKYTIVYENGAVNKTVEVVADSIEKAIKVMGFNPKAFISGRLVTFTESNA